MLANRMLMCMNKRKIDHSTPVTVVNSAYTTSATARPQRLSNGWIISWALNSSTMDNNFYVSKDNGTTWALLTTWTRNASAGFAMCSFGTTIYATCACAVAGTTMNWFAKFDALTVGTTINDLNKPINGQTSFGNGCSISINSTGTVLNICCCSKNSTYSNSFNIIGVKSIDGGITWAKQDGTAGVDQITNVNVSSYDFTVPFVQYDKNNNPIIIFIYQAGTNYRVYGVYWNGSAWSPCNSTGYIYNGNSYPQSNPVATLQKYGAKSGRIWAVWYGADSSDTSQGNIRISYSDDNGITWSSMTKLTSGNSYYQGMPCIANNKNGNVYVLWTGVTSISSGKFNIRQIMWNGSAWGSINEITNQNIDSINNPSICDNFYDYEKPITIWQDMTGKVAFYGVFNV